MKRWDKGCPFNILTLRRNSDEDEDLAGEPSGSVKGSEEGSSKVSCLPISCVTSKRNLA